MEVQCYNASTNRQGRIGDGCIIRRERLIVEPISSDCLNGGMRAR